VCDYLIERLELLSRLVSSNDLSVVFQALIKSF
jgi:hypothetical protein